MEKITAILFFTILLLAQNLNIRAHSLPEKADSRLNLSLPFKKCWEYKFNKTSSFDEQFASDNQSHIIFSTVNGKLELLDTKTVKPIWTSDLSLGINSNIVVDDVSIYFTARNETGLGAGAYILKNISKITGLINWQVDLPFFRDISVESINLSIKGEKIIILGQIGQNGLLIVLNKKDGKELWNRRIDGRQPPVLYNSDNYIKYNYIIVGTSDNKILYFTVDGAVLNEISTKEKVSAIAVPSDNRLIYGDKRGIVNALDFLNKTYVWRFRSGAEITDITTTDYGILISSNDNFLYLLNADKGKLVWKRRMPGRISVKPLISGEYAIIANLSGIEADIIELRSGKIVNRLFLGNEVYLTGFMFLQNNLLILSTLQGLNAFSSSGC